MWNCLTISVLSEIFLSIKVVGALGHCTSLPLNLDPPLIKEYIVKLAVWLVVVIGINVAMHFFLCPL